VTALPELIDDDLHTQLFGLYQQRDQGNLSEEAFQLLRESKEQQMAIKDIEKQRLKLVKSY
jgi:hypothetical protein